MVAAETRTPTPPPATSHVPALLEISTAVKWPQFIDDIIDISSQQRTESSLFRLTIYCIYDRLMENFFEIVLGGG